MVCSGAVDALSPRHLHMQLWLLYCCCIINCAEQSRCGFAVHQQLARPSRSRSSDALLRKERRPTSREAHATHSSEIAPPPSLPIDSRPLTRLSDRPRSHMTASPTTPVEPGFPPSALRSGGVTLGKVPAPGGQACSPRRIAPSFLTACRIIPIPAPMESPAPIAPSA